MCAATQGLARFEELVRKIVDLITNRIENNLEAIRNTMLIDLPADRSFTYEDFITSQIKFNKRQSETLAIRNEEVRRSIDDMVHLVRTYPRENPEEVIDEAEVDAFKLFYSQEMYKVRGWPAGRQQLCSTVLCYPCCSCLACFNLNRHSKSAHVAFIHVVSMQTHEHIARGMQRDCVPGW